MSGWKEIRNAKVKNEFDWVHKDIIWKFIDYLKVSYSSFELFFIADERQNWYRLTYRAKLFPRDLYILFTLKKEDDDWYILKGFSEFNNDNGWAKISSEDDLIRILSNIDDSPYLKRQHSIYESLGQKSSFEGTIFVEELYLCNPNDVVMEISKQDVENIANAEIGSDIEIVGIESKRAYPESSACNPALFGIYKIIEISGMLLRINSISIPENKRIKFSAKKIAPEKPKTLARLTTDPT